MSAEAPRLRDVASGAVWVVAGRDRRRRDARRPAGRPRPAPDPVDFGQAAAALAVVGAVDATTGIGTEVALLQVATAAPVGVVGSPRPRRRPWRADRTRYRRDFAVCRGVLSRRPHSLRWSPAPDCAGSPAASTIPGRHFSPAGLRFKRLSTLDVVDAVVGLTLGVVLALAGAGAWALVVSTVAGLAARSAMSYVVAPRFDLTIPTGADIKALASFGRWVAGTGLLHYVAVRGDQILVGRMLGNGPLGLYSVSHRLSEAPMFALFGDLAGRRRALSVARGATTGRGCDEDSTGRWEPLPSQVPACASPWPCSRRSCWRSRSGRHGSRPLRRRVSSPWPPRSASWCRWWRGWPTPPTSRRGRSG